MRIINTRTKGGEIMSRQKTHEEYIEELKLKNPNIEVLEIYNGSLNKILHRCKIHNYKWYVTPANVLYHTSCPKCSNKYRRTHNDYVEELIFQNPNIIAIDKYIDAKTPIKHKCLIHNYEWLVRPEGILNGSGCPICHKEKLSISKSKTHKEYLQELHDVHPNIIPLENYKGSLIPIRHKCSIDQYEWIASPSSVLNHNCPKCSNHERLDQCSFIERIRMVNSNLSVISKYKTMKDLIKVKCNKDGYEWESKAELLLRGIRCPICNKKSLGEINIINYLDKHNIHYETQKKFNDCKDIKPLPFDFYIPNINTCIEYDGIQHFEPVDFAGKGKEWAEKNFNETIRRDNIKNEFCKNNGVNLVRIPYYKDIESELDLLFAKI